MDMRHARMQAANKASVNNRRPCCSDPRNLRYATALNDSLDYVTLKCKHCGCIHREFSADPGQISLRVR
jgi:hypothetical protein